MTHHFLNLIICFIVNLLLQTITLSEFLLEISHYVLNGRQYCWEGQGTHTVRGAPLLVEVKSNPAEFLGTFTPISQGV